MTSAACKIVCAMEDIAFPMKKETVVEVGSRAESE